MAVVVPMPTCPIKREDAAQALAARIRSLHEEAGALADRAVSRAIDCGRLLTEAKLAVGHGAFGAWVTEHCGFSSRTATRYMRAFEGQGALPATKSDTLSDIEPISNAEMDRILASRRAKDTGERDLLVTARSIRQLEFNRALGEPLGNMDLGVLRRALIELDEGTKQARAELARFRKFRAEIAGTIAEKLKP